MIRSRMTFRGFVNLYRTVIDPSAEGTPAYRTAHKVEFEKWEPGKKTDRDAVSALVNGPDADSFCSVEVAWDAVCTPDPNSANAKWSAATPHANINQTIGNIWAVRDILEMIAKAEGPEGRKNGDYATCEFYVDIYAAPNED